ncbi:MAG: peptidylprolyl isomerase [Planctomycetota bacterium]|jgi:cyclophilin family peptidyl-prolyl cis-trans isomerase
MSRTAALLTGLACVLTGAPAAEAQQKPPAGLAVAIGLDTTEAKIGDAVNVKVTVTNNGERPLQDVLLPKLDYFGVWIDVKWKEHAAGAGAGDKKVDRSYTLYRHLGGPYVSTNGKRVTLQPGDSIEETIPIVCLRADSQTIQVRYFGYSPAPSGAISSNALELFGSTPGEGDLGATFETTAGTMEFKLARLGMPNTVQNFVQLARAGTYDGTQLFRVMPGAWAHGGCTNNDGTSRPGWGLPMEGGVLKHVFGTLSMARGASPRSAGNQFFFSLATLKQYDWGAGYPHAAFGSLVKGEEVLKALAKAEVTAHPDDSPFARERSKPAEPVTIKKVTIWVR